jgi:hypothetical protein
MLGLLVCLLRLLVCLLRLLIGLIGATCTGFVAFSCALAIAARAKSKCGSGDQPGNAESSQDFLKILGLHACLLPWLECVKFPPGAGTRVLDVSIISMGLSLGIN